jgi:quercetin dioxygenase-like cupin family protein
MKTKVLAATLLALLVTAAVAFGARAPVVAKTLATGQMQAATVHATTGTSQLVLYTVAPGGSFGWHSHGATVAVIVQSGTLTVRDPDVSNCAPFKVSKGQSFFEPAGHVHWATNEGSKPVKVYAMYLGVPKGSKVYNPTTAPSGCGG